MHVGKLPRHQLNIVLSKRMCVQDLQNTRLHTILAHITVQSATTVVLLEIVITSLEGSEHDLSRHRVLILLRRTFVKSLTHHQNGIAVVPESQLNIRQLRHRDAYGVLQMLLCQVLNLQLLLVDCTLVL